jgi:hypothetical protein
VIARESPAIPPPTIARVRGFGELVDAIGSAFELFGPRQDAQVYETVTVTDAASMGWGGDGLTSMWLPPTSESMQTLVNDIYLMTRETESYTA